MDDKFNIIEAINFMKEKEVVTTGNNDYFSIVDNNVHYKFNGSSVSIKIDDFKKLFKDSSFSLIEGNSVLIDDLKDKEYYEKYKK